MDAPRLASATDPRMLHPRSTRNVVGLVWTVRLLLQVGDPRNRQSAAEFSAGDKAEADAPCLGQLLVVSRILESGEGEVVPGFVEL